MVEEWEREAKAVKTLYNENWRMEIQHSEWLAGSDPETATNGQLSLTRKSIRNICLKRQKESQVRQTKNRPEKMPLCTGKSLTKETSIVSILQNQNSTSKQQTHTKNTLIILHDANTYKIHPRHFAWRCHVAQHRTHTTIFLKGHDIEMKESKRTDEKKKRENNLEREKVKMKKEKTEERHKREENNRVN